MSNDGETRVALVRSTYKNVYDRLNKILEYLEYAPKKENIFIKPNLVGSYAPNTGYITHPSFVEALVRIFRERYPRSEIVVGDGCAVHDHWENVLEKSKYRSFADRYGVRLVSLDELPRKKFSWAHGELDLPELLETHEYINVAKLKTHAQATVTLCIKNQKGLLRKKVKQDFHRRMDLHDCIRALSETVRPDLNLIDGILSVEGNGPIPPGITKKGTNLILGSRNIYAIDNAAARIMGFSPSEIPHLPEFGDYTVVGENIEQCVTPFKRPDPSPWIKNNVYSHFDETVCSLCAVSASIAYAQTLSNLPFVLKVMKIGGLAVRKDVVMGALPGVPEGAGQVLGIGDCTAKLAKKNGFSFIRGCPPKIPELKAQYLEFCKRAKKTQS